MALSSLWKRTFRVLGGWLLPLSMVSILVSSCASASGTATPTPTVPTVYTTAAAETAVWQTLRQRPLHMPTGTPGTPCPTAHGHLLATGEGIAVGSGPLYAVLGQLQSTGADQRQRQGILQYVDAQAYGPGASGWGGMKVLWVIDVHYSGPVLIRGHQVDGPHDVRFNGGLDQLYNVTAVASVAPAGTTSGDELALTDPFASPWVLCLSGRWAHLEFGHCLPGRAGPAFVRGVCSPWKERKGPAQEQSQPFVARIAFQHKMEYGHIWGSELHAHRGCG